MTKMIFSKKKAITAQISKQFSLIFLMMSLSISSTIALSPDSLLTHAELSYLQELGPVTLCIDPDWRPYEYLNENNEYSGIAADLLAIISQRTGIEFRLVHAEDWDESLELSQQGKCMALAFLNQTPERDEWLLFTYPYFTEPNVFITREEHDFITDPGILMNETIALPRGTSIEERIRMHYPNLEIKLYNNEEQAIKAVNDRKADMTLRSLTMAAYIIKSEGWFNLKIAGQVPTFMNELRVGITKDHPMLRDILNKAIATLSDQDIRSAVNKHISITVVAKPDYGMIKKISIVVLLLILISLIWNYQLRKINGKLATSERKHILLSEQLQKDIEVRKDFEQSLKIKETQLSNLISNLPGFIYHCKNDDYYTMEYISEGCLDITGYEPFEFINNSKVKFALIIFPDELPAIRAKWSKVLDTREHFEHEYKISHADGSVRWVWERGHGIFNENDELIYIEGFITDITERKNVEKQLTFQNRFYKLISDISSSYINSNPENIERKINQMLEESGKFLQADRTFLFQISDDQQYMSNSHEWCAKEVLAAKDLMQNYPIQQVPIIAEIVKNRKVFYVPDVDALPEGKDKEELIRQQVKSVLCLPIVKGSLFLGYYGFDSVKSKREITDKEIGLLQVLANILGDALLRNKIELKNRQSEAELRVSEAQLRQLNAQKDKFFSIIAHDLRSPFTAILGFSELLARQISTNDYEGIGMYAEMLIKSSKNTMDLLMNLLEWSRSQTGLIEFNPEPLDLKELITTTTFLLREVAHQKSINISLNIRENSYVYADRHMFNTVLRNLVSNAIKFTPLKGSISITARNEGHSTFIAVTDNGIGIPPERLGKLFRIDNNVSTPGTANEEGTGLGLILCKEFIDKHNGTLQVESEPGKGSVFMISIPQLF